MNTLERKLPIGIQTFEDIRRGNYLYVDKTSILWQIINTGKPYFLSRPRRFGKSLLVSTFEAYFQGRKDLFEGLAIEKLETKWEQYPVLHLDLNAKRYETAADLVAMLNQYLEKWEAVYAVPQEISAGGTGASIVPGFQVILLIFFNPPKLFAVNLFLFCPFCNH